MKQWRGYDHNNECLDCDEPRGEPHDDACPAAALSDEIEAMLKVTSVGNLLVLVADVVDARANGRRR